MEATLRGFFVCDKCRAECHNGEDVVGVFGPDRCPPAYFPRKQRVGCLGPYCDTPCKLRRKLSDLTMEQLIDLVKYLGERLNEFLITTPESESASQEGEGL